jgi:hypothetical protein
MVALFAFTLIFGIKKQKIQQQKIEVLEKEMLDLKEYEQQ